jgi:tetratricopeptide (TPR) repeat protein
MNKKQIRHRPEPVKQKKQSKTAEVSLKNSRFYWMPLVCIILAIIVYSPVFHAGFVNWDDDDYVVKNHSITSFENLKEILTNPVQGNYHPLTMLTLAVNYAISGAQPGSYHIVNLLIHLLNILLVFLFVMKLTGNKPWLSFIVALLFAIHPLHVESVAWISERKDVLYSFFFLAGSILYLRYLKTGKIGDYLYVFILFILSLLSKPAAIIFPVILLAIDYYNGRLKAAKTYFEKVPFFLLSLVLGFLTLHSQKLQGGVGAAALFPFHFRFFFGFYGLMMYIVKVIWPINLCTFYPFPPVNHPLPMEYYIYPLIGAVLFVVLFFFYRKSKLMIFALFFFLINLILVLQFIPVGSAIISDRYTYLPLTGIFLIPGYYYQKWVDDHKGKLPTMGLFLLVVVSIIMSVLTFRQSGTWKDDAALWDNAIRVAPSSKAYLHCGMVYTRENRSDKALEMFNNAIQLNNLEKDALINRGNIYFDRKQYELAIADYNACLAIDSTTQLAIENRGSAYAATGKSELAIADMDRAIKMDPNTEKGYANRAFLYQAMNRDNEAISDFYKHMAVNHKESADILNSIAISYNKLKEFDKVLDVLSQAIALEPRELFYLNRAIAYKELGRMAEARADGIKAESIKKKINN